MSSHSDLTNTGLSLTITSRNYWCTRAYSLSIVSPPELASGISYTPGSGSVDTAFSDFALSDTSCTALTFTTTLTGCTWTKIDSTAGTWVSMPSFSGSSGSYKMNVNSTDN